MNDIGENRFSSLSQDFAESSVEMEIIGDDAIIAEDGSQGFLSKRTYSRKSRLHTRN